MLPLRESLTRLRKRLSLTGVAIALVTFAVFGALSTLDAWRRIEYKGFDFLTVLTAKGLSTLPITIVGIDEASFVQVGKQWPWPRRMHAQLIDQLNKAGALVIALDVQLGESSNPEDDQLLADAIQRAGNVVIASHMAYQEDKYVKQWIRIDPLDMFRAAGAGGGLANVSLESDLVVRRMPEGRDVFWREILARMDQLQPGLIKQPPSQEGKFIGFTGPDHTFPYASYYQALNADKELPPDVFRDQIVLVGRDVKASPDVGAAQADTFGTPFTSWTGWLTPGPEIHANVMESAIIGNSKTALDWQWSLLLLMVAITFSSLLMRRWRPFRSAAVVVVLVIAIGAFDWWLFVHQSLWLPALAAVLSVATVYAALGARAFIAEQRQRRETRRAFSMYVSEEVVNAIMAHPEGLKLGGERRELTLLFTDLAGFTNFSEKLGPEQVTQLLNEHFSRATAIIKRHGGTVNRFIGDAIMAFWGAPLANEKHAINACLAARDMQLDMKELRASLMARGLPAVNMRVGLHTGVAVVGNLGATDRFDYTAIGDNVNLAARLEGVNKLYGTEILLSGTTASMLDGQLPLRLVDRVIVKGKSEAVEIYTISENAEINALSERACAAYRAQHWDESESLWRELLLIDPQDTVAQMYLERIAELRLDPPPADWGGEIAAGELC